MCKLTHTITSKIKNHVNIFSDRQTESHVKGQRRQDRVQVHHPSDAEHYDVRVPHDDGYDDDGRQRVVVRGHFVKQFGLEGRAQSLLHWKARSAKDN